MKQYSVLLLAALCVTSSAMAQDGVTCRDAIARIATSAVVEVVNRDSTVAKGEFHSFNRDYILLNTHPLGEQRADVKSYPINDIMKIKYEKSGSVNPWFMLLGLAGGAIVGIPVSAAAASGSSGFSGLNTRLGVWMGCTVAGLLAGMILPAVHRSEQTIECK